MHKGDAAVGGDSISSPAPSNHGLPQGPVEARSLSSITAVASNPPAYPRNPTQKKLDPLVLYIVRVPGSKDVVLTPLKPPTKSSVSAEAINSSLYYLHVSTPEDDVLLQEVVEEREEENRIKRKMLSDEAETSQPAFARMNNVRRKPVPGGDSGSTNTDNTTPHPLPSPPRPQSLALTDQKQQENNVLFNPAYLTSPEGAPSASSRATSDTREQLMKQIQAEDTTGTRGPSLPRQPLLSTPKEEEVAFNIPEKRHPAKKSERWSAYFNGRGPENWKEKFEALSTGRLSLDSRPPQLRPHSAHGPPSYIRQGSPSRSPGQSPSRRPHDTEPPGFHITLIRRDPTHGSQWNVATISTSQIDSSATDIEVSTPGYNRFTAQDEPFSLESLGLNLPSGGGPISLSAFKPKQTGSTENNVSRGPQKFHRQLCVSKLHQDDTRSSMDTVESFSGSPTRRPKLGHSKLKSGYYTFTSPWNGVCTFSTSVNGRSLKCKHMIPTPSFPGTRSRASDTHPAVTVAEIRFNTPFPASHLHHQHGPSLISPHTLSQFSKEHGAEGGSFTTPSTPNDKSSKRNSFANFLKQNTPNRPRSHSSANATSSNAIAGIFRKPSTSSTSSGAFDSDRERERRPLRRPPSEDRLDFSLARENAGGGMRGKSAKLGKIIIEDEGIKMLDLVVGACMAVWWRAYYH